MKEMNLEAKLENIPVVTGFIEEQLEALDCPMKAQMRGREEDILGSLGITRD